MSTDCKSKCWKIVVLVLAGIAVLGWFVMLLWNWLIPELFVGVRTVNYLQAVGVLLLGKILFGGLQCPGCHGKWCKLCCGKVTPEERAGCCAGEKEKEGAGMKQ